MVALSFNIIINLSGWGWGIYSRPKLESDFFRPFFEKLIHFALLLNFGSVSINFPHLTSSLTHGGGQNTDQPVLILELELLALSFVV